MSEVSIRPATADDIPRIEQIRLQHVYPGHLALMGSDDRAMRYSSGRTKLDRIPNAAKVTVVAEVDGTVEGVLQYTFGSDAPRAGFDHARLLFSLLGPLGLVRRLPVLRARERVKIPVPADAFRVFNLQVDIAFRCRGIATQLLDWAEDEARRLDAPRMALLADSTSAAVRLYERNGYRTTVRATDHDYERYTEDPGRVLMEKDLGPAVGCEPGEHVDLPTSDSVAVELRELQRVIEATYGDRDNARGVAATVAWIAEEVGELAQAVRKGSREQQVHELGDVLAWVASLASQLEIGLEECAARFMNGCPHCRQTPCACA